MAIDDAELLAAVVRNRDSESFKALMQRHMGFVYAAALRQSWNRAGADDITQAVFLLLWQRAGSIGAGVPIKAWLFKATRYVAANARRAEGRRTIHEREAAVMRTENISPAVAAEISPVLDDALASLPERDRRAVLLRYFEDQPLAMVGTSLGVSEEAAKKRVSRAVGKLKRFFARRGVDAGLEILPGVLASHATRACPAQLMQSVLQLASGGAAQGPAVSLAKGASKMVFRNRMKIVVVKCLVVMGCAGAVAAAVMTEDSGTSTPAPIVVAQAQTDSSAATEAEDPDYQACRGVLQGIIDAYQQNDEQKLQSLFYADPEIGGNFMSDLEIATEADLAAFRLRKAALGRFGPLAMDLNTRTSYLESYMLDVLARSGPGDLTVQNDSASLVPPAGVPGVWPSSPVWFRQVGDVWKLDVGQCIKISHKVARREPVAGETEDQVYAAYVRELVGKFNAISDGIDQGRIRDLVEAQGDVDRIFADMQGEYVRGATIRILPR
jgi:RNA polymerase sigma factor (sigma-70 family)